MATALLMTPKAGAAVRELARAQQIREHRLARPGRTGADLILHDVDLVAELLLAACQRN